MNWLWFLFIVFIFVGMVNQRDDIKDERDEARQELRVLSDCVESVDNGEEDLEKCVWIIENRRGKRG